MISSISSAHGRLQIHMANGDVISSTRTSKHHVFSIAFTDDEVVRLRDLLERRCKSFSQNATIDITIKQEHERTIISLDMFYDKETE